MKKYLIFATKKGLIKKTGLEDYANIRKSGLVAIKLSTEDQLLSTKLTSGKDEVVLVSKLGKSIRFREEDVRPTGRATMGVKGIKLRKEDELVSMLIISKEKPKKRADQDEPPKKLDELLIVAQNGYGKRTLLTEYNIQGRGGQGVFTAKISNRTGDIVNADLVSSEDTTSDLLVISRAGKIIRLPLGQISQLGRHTQGVKLINLDSGDSVASFTLL